MCRERSPTARAAAPCGFVSSHRSPTAWVAFPSALPIPRQAGGGLERDVVRDLHREKLVGARQVGCIHFQMDEHFKQCGCRMIGQVDERSGDGMPPGRLKQAALPREIGEVRYPPQSHGVASGEHAVFDPVQHSFHLARARFAGEKSRAASRRSTLAWACAASDGPWPVRRTPAPPARAIRLSRSALSVSSTVSNSLPARRRASVRLGTTRSKISASE